MNVIMIHCIVYMSFMIASVTAVSAQDKEQLKDAKPLYGFIENKGQVKDQNHKQASQVKYILPLPNNNVVLRPTGFSYDTYVTESKDLSEDARRNLIRDKFKEQQKDVTHKFHRVDVEFVGANAHPEIVSSERSVDHINYYGGANSNAVSVHHYGKVTYKNIYPNIDVEFIARPGQSKPVEYNFIVYPGADVDVIQLRYSGANASELSADGKLVMTLAHGKLSESIPASYWQKSKERENIKYRKVTSKGSQITVGFSGHNIKGRNQPLVIDPTPGLEWGTYYGGNAVDHIYGVEVDNSANIYVTGATSSSTAIATIDAPQTIYKGNDEAFLAKFNSNGVLQWGTYYGGSSVDIGEGVAIDGAGNVYMAGLTASEGLATAESYQPTLAWIDAFLVKLNSSGVLQWATYYGGSAQEDASGITTDASGNVYIAGYTNSSDNIATEGSYKDEAVVTDYVEAFLAKFNTDGDLEWGTYYGGGGHEEFYDVATDGSGNVYATGATLSDSQHTSLSSSISTSGAHQTTQGDNYDAFLVKFNSSGTTRQWATYYGGDGTDAAYSLVCDAAGNTYITGVTYSTSATSAIFTAGGHQTSPGSDHHDGFIAKFNTSGVRQWGTYYGGDGNDECYGIDLDDAGNLFVVGITLSTTSISTAGVYQENPGSDHNDAFVVKFNSGGVRQWGTYYGGSSIDIASAVVAYGSGNAFVVGQTSSQNSIATPGVHQPVKAGTTNPDAFIAKFVPCYFPDPLLEASATQIYKGKSVTITASNHQTGYTYEYRFYYGTSPEDQTYESIVTTNGQLTYTFHDLGAFYPALGTHTIEVTTTTPESCPRTIIDLFTVEVKDIVPLCETIIPASTSGELKLDKFSGRYVFQFNSNCLPDISIGCIQGEVEAPQFKSVVSASATTFSDSWEQSMTGAAVERGAQGKWRPQATYAYNKGAVSVDKNLNSGKFQLSHFNWQYPEVTKKAGWLKVNEITKYSAHGDAIEEKNALDIMSAAKFGYTNTVPYMIAQNADYNSILFESFENIYSNLLEDNMELSGGTRDESVQHSGKYSLKLDGLFVSRTFLRGDLDDKGMLVRLWAKVSETTPFELMISAPGHSLPTSSFTSIARSGEWSLWEARILPGVLSLQTEESNFTLRINKLAAGDVWIDDVRIQPLDAEATCYVYDVNTLKLLASFDDQHFALFYQYNAEGKLVRKMIETERGIKTVQETQYNTPEVNKSSFIGQ